jgi:hypothetical protein
MLSMADSTCLPGPPPSHSAIGDVDSVSSAESSQVSESAPALDDRLPETGAELRLPPFPVPWRHPLQSAFWTVRVTFGLASLILLLAVIAAIPLVNFLALGYLLDAEGRVARTGRLRDSVPLIHLAPRLGSIALGFWLWLLPLRFLSGVAADAQLIDPSGVGAHRMQILATTLWAVVTIHLCLALARGGTFGCFFRPIKNVRWLWRRFRDHDYWSTASVAVRSFIRQLEIKRHFLLGLKGFGVGLVWLFLPTALYAAMKELKPGPGFVTVAGGLLMTWVLAWMPFLQARFAATGRWRDGFQLKECRENFRHAPFAWLIAILGVYVLSLPLYLTKVALPPADAMWLLTLVFIVSIYPARILTGWAYHRAVKKREEKRRSWFVTRFATRLVILPLVGFYVFILFFTQFISEHGKRALFEHHAFLLPWPG